MMNKINDKSMHLKNEFLFFLGVPHQKKVGRAFRYNLFKAEKALKRISTSPDSYRDRDDVNNKQITHFLFIVFFGIRECYAFASYLAMTVQLVRVGVR